MNVNELIEKLKSLSKEDRKKPIKYEEMGRIIEINDVYVERNRYNVENFEEYVMVV